ncbi:VWA domain-containing protein [Candidatus Poribacteria bacterium]|nr:VWA domain-containing protein [Candidatus Poribacteria bacterium]
MARRQEGKTARWYKAFYVLLIIHHSSRSMNFIKFGHPQYLYFLGFIPLFILLYIYVYKQKRKASERFSDFRLFQQLASSVNFRRQKIKSLMVIFGYTFLTLALTRPQFGSRLELVEKRGLDIMVALDISLSMQAEDVKPNRFQKAKYEIQTLIDKLDGDRVGLIIFAGDSFVQCPLTNDYDVAKMLLDVPPEPEYLLQKELIHPGTDIGRAIRFGIRLFQQGEAKGKATKSHEVIHKVTAERSEYKYKVLILVTDGEVLLPSSDPLEATKEAAKLGIYVYALGVGVPGQGTPIPLHDHEGKFIEYKKDRTGELVLTQLNDTLLRKISTLSGGRYYLASAKGAEVDDLYKDISNLERKELEKSQFTQYEERFQYFLLGALILLAVELILSERKMIYSR